jgi:hypothetical protein
VSSTDCARVSGALACVVVALLAAPRANAAPAWLAPADVSEEGQKAAGPQVAFDKQGDAVVVWERREGTDNSVQAAFRPAGGAWQAPAMFSTCDEGACEPQVAFDVQGDAVVVWDAYNGAHFNVQSAFKPAGGAWQASVYLSSNEAPGADHPQVAFDAQGDALAIWNRQGPWGGAVQESFRPVGGAWQAPVNITAAEEGDDPQIAFDKQGNALALWWSFEGGDIDEWVLESASMPPGGQWQAPVAVSAPDLAGSPHIAFDAQGDAVAVWDGWTHGFLSHRVAQSAFRPAGGAWHAPVDISEVVSEGDEPDNREASEPDVAVDEQGNAIVVWGRAFGVQAAFRAAGGTWQAPVDLSTPFESASNPRVVFDVQGNVIAVWSLQPSIGAPNIIQSAFKPAVGAWQAPVDLSDESHSAYEPQVAFDGQGDAVAVWNGEGGIQGAGYAAAGPHLNSLSIPTEGTVGQPIAFSVSPLDVWSVPGETSWSFGDGASASGTSVTHTYTVPGTYTVTLHSTDELGNGTSTGGKVTIAPAVTTAPTPSPPAPTLAAASIPPTIGAVSQSASVWHQHGKSRIGTTFSISLNEQAAVGFSFLRHVNGRMAGRKCLATTPRNAGRRVCSRTVITGAFSFAGHSGMNKVGFQGLVLHAKKLSPGRYTLVITATNAAGQRSSPKSLSFTVMG